MENSLEECIHVERYTSASIRQPWFDIEITPITRKYLASLGMTDDEIIELHQAVWDLAFRFDNPTERKKISRRIAREIKAELEKKYDLQDYDKRLDGEPENCSYEECVDQVVERLDSSRRIVICGGVATGKTTLAKRIKRTAKREGFDVEIFDEYSELPWRVDGPTIQCVPYFPEEQKCDVRVYVSVPKWRKIWNALKRLPVAHQTPGLFTQNITLRDHYRLDFQKSVSDLVVRYSRGRFVLFDHFQRTNRNKNYS